MSVNNLSSEDKTKLTQLVEEGMQVLQEVDDLKGGLRDTVKSIADEMDIKPSVLNKAISIAHKAKLTGLVIESDKVILVKKDLIIALLERHNMFLFSTNFFNKTFQC